MKHSAKALARQAKAQQATARRATAQRTAGQPTTGQPTTGQPTTGQPTTRHATTGQQGGGKDGGTSGRRQLLAQLPYWLVIAGMVAGLATIRGGGQAVRGGTLVIAGALLAGSLARLVLPEGKAGMLGSRRRIVDVGILGILGVGLLVAGLIVVVPRS